MADLLDFAAARYDANTETLDETCLEGQ